MKNLILLALIGFTVTVNAQSAKQFNFLVGTWSLKDKTGETTEKWFKATDSLVGESTHYNLKGEKKLLETVVIKKLAGAWNYCVTGQQKFNAGTTNFKLISYSNNVFVFENKVHDYPQRIYYQPKGKNSLLAWIEGKANGKKMKSEYAYQRRKPVSN